MANVHDFTYRAMDGSLVSLSDYKGKVLLIVNTASKCGFTPQFEGLEALYQQYKDRGFEVIGFPCGQFHDQEYHEKEEIESFCKLRYGVTFPLSEKVEVRGDAAHPLFKYLTDNTTFIGLDKAIKDDNFAQFLKKEYGDSIGDSSIKWNFTKFLIGKDGSILGRFEPPVEPKDIAPAIEALL